MRDFDFKSALAGQLGNATMGDVQMRTTSASHIAASGVGMPGVRVQYRSEYQGSVDGNTVNMDTERSAFIENSVQVEALLAFMHSNSQAMNLALQSS